MDKIDWRIVCAGMACITALELYALSQGINGTMISLVLVIIAGSIGVTLPQWKTK